MMDKLKIHTPDLVEENFKKPVAMLKTGERFFYLSFVNE